MSFDWGFNDVDFNIEPTTSLSEIETDIAADYRSDKKSDSDPDDFVDIRI